MTATISATSPPIADRPTADRWPLARALLVGFLTLLALWPLWAGDFLPFPDAAQVQHQASVIWDWNLEAVFRRDFVRAPFPVPNWFGIALITALAPLGGVAVAHKLVLSLAAVGVVAASGWLLRQAGHSRWLLVAALPFAWHHDVFLGHLAQSVGLPIFLGLLGAHLGLCKQPGPWRALLVALALALLAVTNLLLWFAGALGVAVLGAAFGWWRSRWRGLLTFGSRDAALVLPSLALLAPWYARDVAPEGGLANWAAEFTLPVDSVRAVLANLFDVFAPRGTSLESLADLLFNRPGDVITGMWLAGAGLWIFAAVRKPPSEAVEPPPQSRYLAVAAALVGLLYFALPLHVFRPVWIHGVAPRLCGAALLLMILALRVDPLRPPPRARVRAWAGNAAMLACAVWLPLAGVRSTVLVQPEFDHLREALAKIPHGKAVLVLRPAFESHWMQANLFADVGQYAAVLRGSAVPFTFIDPVLQPVRPRRDRLLPAPPGDNHDRFNWHEHGRFYDYVALFREPFAPEPRYEAVLRSWPQVFRRGKWQVFQNQHPEPFPPPPGPREPPADADSQFVEAAMESLGRGLGVDWSQGYVPTPEVLDRDERFRGHLGLPARNAGMAPPEPITAPRPMPADAPPPTVPDAPTPATDSAPAPRYLPRPMAMPPAIVAPMLAPVRLPEPASPVQGGRGVLN